MDTIAQLRLPLKAVAGLNTSIDELGDHVASVNIDCHQCDDLLAVTLCEFSVDLVRQFIQLQLALVFIIFACVVVTFLELVKHSVYIICVDDTRHENAHLRALFCCPFVALRFVIIHRRIRWERLVATSLVPPQ